MALSVGGIVASLGAKLDDAPFDRYERRIRSARQDASKDVTADLKADVDTKGFGRYEKAIGGAEKSTHKFRGGLLAIGPAAATAAAAGGGAAILLGKRFIETASDISESSSKLETVLGAQAKQVEDFAKTSATTIGQSRSATLEATGTFAAFFKNLGQGSKASAESSIAFTKLASDMASFNNTSPEEAVQALSAGLRGEAEPLRRYGVLLDDASLRQEALKQGLVKTTKDALTPQNRALAAQGLIFKQTKTQQGDFERTSKGLANQQRTLAAQISDVGAKIGDKLLPFATKAITALNGLIDSTAKGKGPIAAFGRVVGKIGDVIGNVVGYAVDFGRSIRSVFSGAGGDGGKLASNLERTFRDIIGTVRSLGRSVARTFSDVGGDLRDIGRGFLKVFRAIQDVIQPVIRSVLPGLRRAIQGIADVVRGFVRTVAALFRGDFAEAWRGLKQMIGGALNAVRGVLGAAVSAWLTLAKKLGKAVLDGIIDIVTGLPGKLKDLFVAAIKGILKLDKWVLDKVADLGRAVVHGIVNGIESIPDVIKNAAKKLANGLVKAVKSFLGIESPSKVFKGIGKNIVDGLANGLNAGDIKKLAEKAFGGLPSIAAKLIKGGVIDVSKLSITGARKLGDKLGSIGSGALDKLGLNPDGSKKEQTGAGVAGGVGGLVPQVLRAIAWARAHGWRGSVQSGYRSRAEQQYLWDNRASNPYPVARPGTSNHESGQAIDVSDIDGFRRAMASAPANARLQWFGPGDKVHFSVTGRRVGGKVGPFSGGARAFIAGEGSKDEWVISQEGDRKSNIQWAREALEQLTGKPVPLHSGGTDTKKKKTKKVAPKLSKKTNAGINSALSRGNKGIQKFDDEIVQMERDYDQASRIADIDGEDFITENDDGSTTINETAKKDRLDELGAARTARENIKKKIHAYRQAITKLIAAYRKAIGQIQKALKAAKGKKRAKERQGYRDRIDAYQGRISELQALKPGLNSDEIDSGIDLQELDAEIATINGTAAQAADPVEPEKPDPPDLSLDAALTADEKVTAGQIEKDQALAELTATKTDDEEVRKRGQGFYQGILDRLKGSGAADATITDAARALKGFLPEAVDPTTPTDPTTTPEDPLAQATALLQQLGAFDAARADVFSQFGANFLTGRVLTAADQMAGGRYFGGGSGGGQGAQERGKTVNQYITLTSPQEDPHTFIKAINFEEAAAV